MNMSEFENLLNNDGDDDDDDFPSVTSGKYLLDDFSDEEMKFARELDMLFDLDREEMPPHFVQTVLRIEDPRFQPVEAGFEHKTRARVFRRLKLRRWLFQYPRFSLRQVFDILPGRRVMVAMSMAFTIIMAITVMFTGTSFAAGMQILLHGANTGTLEVPAYPSHVSGRRYISTTKNALTDIDYRTPQQSLLATQHDLHFPMYWPDTLPGNYDLSKLSLYQEYDQTWADGPSFELDYTYSNSAHPAQGTGLVAIREFKLNSNVRALQVVKDGTSEPIQIDQSGRAQAIYVDGQWVLHNKLAPTWVYGQRSELIYQKDGIVFWIVGDQRDGINKNVLLSIAQSLTVFTIDHTIHMHGEGHMPTVNTLDSQTDTSSPFAGDILAVFLNDSGTVTFVSFGGSIQASPDQPLSTGGHER